MDYKAKITKMHYDKNPKSVVFGILKAVSLFYGFGSNLKNILYDNGIVSSKRVDCFVISVGNLTTGGVGKTPVVAEIANYYLLKGKKVAIVSRGYGGKLSNKKINLISDGENIFYDASQAGDEPYWLSQNTKAIIITSKNRYKAAKFAKDNYDVDIIILDDGFQHRKLYRDENIVLVDSEKQFGNECQLPAGPLRESIGSITRADKLVVVSKNINHEDAERFARSLERKYELPVFICKVEPEYVYNIKSNFHLQKGVKTIAMCAIGQPEQFFKFLDGYAADEKIVYDDHHKYKKTDIPNTTLPIITTEKDAVKLKDFDFDNIYALKLKTELDVKNLLKSVD